MAAAKASLQGGGKVEILHAPIWLKFQEIIYSVLFESVISNPEESCEQQFEDFKTEYWLVIERVKSLT